jgi:hypothetical protein
MLTAVLAFFEFLGPLGDEPCTHSLHHCFCPCLLPPLPYNFAVDAATYTAGGLSAVGALFIIGCIWAYDRQPKLFTKLVLVLSCVDFLVRAPKAHHPLTHQSCSFHAESFTMHLFGEGVGKDRARAHVPCPCVVAESRLSMFIHLPST